MRNKLTVVSLGFCLGLCAPSSLVAFEATQAETVAFIKADRNQSYSLDKNEFKVFVREMALTGQSTAKTIVAFKAFAFAFKIADKNRDGVISPQELRNADNNHRNSN